MRVFPRLVLSVLLIGCASSSPDRISASFQRLDVGGRQFTYRAITCAPTFIETDTLLLIQGVEIKESGRPSTEDYLAASVGGKLATPAPLLPAIGFADLPPDEAIAFKLRIIAINAVCAATCQTIAQLGDRPDLVLKYSLERDRLLHDLLLLAFVTQARKEPPDVVSHFSLRGHLTDEELVALRASAMEGIATRISTLESLNAALPIPPTPDSH